MYAVLMILVSNLCTLLYSTSIFRTVLLCGICEELCIKQVTKMSLKGLCHQDIAALDQFCAEVVTYCFYPNTKCSSRVMKKISNNFLREH